MEEPSKLLDDFTKCDDELIWFNDREKFMNPDEKSKIYLMK